MEPIGEIVKRRLNQHKLGEASVASEVLFNAQKWLHVCFEENFEENPHAVRPLKLQGGVLTLGVQSSGWAQEVHQASSRLLRNLQEKHGKTLIKKIQIKSLTNF